MVHLHVACVRCRRKGRYRITGLIDRYGATMGLPELRYLIAADCPRIRSASIYDRCGAYYPGLSGRDRSTSKEQPEKHGGAGK